MKIDLIKKAKWYIVGFIAVAILLSVSLSFCAWDNLEIKARLSQGNSGKYEFKWNDAIKDINGNKLTDIPSVGSIVTYGNFYQSSDALDTGNRAPQRWIVVDYNEQSKIATLLTEKVIVYGNFWGTEPMSLNNYYRSSVRSWLNSGKGSLKSNDNSWVEKERFDDNVRNDGLPIFNGESQVNTGFLDSAFNIDEKSILIPKRLVNLKCLDENNVIINSATSDNRNYINDLVWLPSYYEIYGATGAYGNWLIDGVKENQFSYFAKNNTDNYKIAGATDYAWNANATSYYNNGNGRPSNSKDSTLWWLRSPCPNDYRGTLRVGEDGSGGYALSYRQFIGVRPAVCVQL